MSDKNIEIKKHLKEQTDKEQIDKEQIDHLFTEEFFEQSKSWIWQYNKMMAYYRCAIMEIETKFNVLNEEFSLRYDRNPISSIKTRLKTLRSIKGKLDKKNLPYTLEEVRENLNDIAGVRVICAFKEDVYMLAEALLKQDDITLVRKKDYIKNPKENGYRSLHLIVTVPIFLAKEKEMMKVEIQIRTIAMDFWASLEHQLHYKKTFLFTEEMAKELYDCAELSAELDARMDSLRNRAQIDVEEEDEYLEA